MGDFEITVDEHDNVVGSQHWRDMSYKHIYRVSAVWISDIQTGDLLIAQRSFAKKNHPGVWGPSAAGMIEVDENYDDNIVKEIEEELGLTGLELTKGPKVFTDDGQNRFFCQWYFAKTDKNTAKITMQVEEVEAVKWLSLNDILKDLKQNPRMYLPEMSNSLSILK